MRAGSSKANRRFVQRVLAATILARGGPQVRAGRSGFTGTRIGRGAGIGLVLASRGVHSAFRQRRVVIKTRIVKLAGKGLGAARAHLRYVERDGTTRTNGRGQLYGPDTDQVDRRTWLENAGRDRHQFRFIVSPEDGDQYDDLKPLTRRLMSRMEEDLGTRLDWVAVDHYNTAHPHSHIILRGKDDRGGDLIIARDYITRGMRERACELVDLDLGPCSERETADRLRAEIEQERLTRIDHMLIRDAGVDGLVASAADNAFDQSLRAGRLKKLERLGLATKDGATQWRLDPNLADTLRRIGERGDIIRTMQRTYADRVDAPGHGDRVIFDPATHGARHLVGLIVARGLSDEVEDRQYVILEATDGRSHYVDIGKAGDTAPSVSSIVRISPVSTGPRAVDRTVHEIARVNGGRYTIDLHLRHDPGATQAFAEAHVRRLEAMRRLAGAVGRDPDGTWRIAEDHLDRAAAFEAARAKDRPVIVETLSSYSLEQQIGAEAATWLDRELIRADPLPLREAGFGRALGDAQARRRQWLIAQGLAEARGTEIVYRSDLVETLRRRELLRVAARLSDEIGLPFAEVRTGKPVDGVLRRSVELVSGRFALVERSRDFTLVPWRDVLERQLGKQVSGIVRDDGMSWALGRHRGGPSIP